MASGSWTCPITHEFFTDPVVAQDGLLYDAGAIRRWVAANPTSPMTRAALAPVFWLRTTMFDELSYNARTWEEAFGLSPEALATVRHGAAQRLCVAGPRWTDA